MKHAAVFLLAVLLASGCKKMPVNADFSSNKQTYLAGDTIKLRTVTRASASFKWTMPGGQTFTTADPEYSLDPRLNDTTVSFKLEAFSKTGKRLSSCTKSLTVLASGEATIWSGAEEGITYYVYVDNVFITRLNAQYDPVLQKYQPAHVCRRFSVGYHKIVVTGRDPNITEILLKKGDSLNVMM